MKKRTRTPAAAAKGSDEENEDSEKPKTARTVRKKRTASSDDSSEDKELPAKDAPKEEKGWTTTGEVAAIIAKFTPALLFGTTPNKAESIGGLFYIKGVDAAAAKRLSKLMPQSSLSMAQNASPTVQQFIGMAAKHPNEVFLHGYVVPPPRSDERISIEGCHLRLNDPDEKKAHKTFRKWLKEARRLEEFAGPVDEKNIMNGRPDTITLAEGQYLFYSWWD